MANIIPIYRRCRKDFSKIKEVLEISNLIEIQKRSYEKFLQADVDPDKREPFGLQTVFKTVFPIKDFYETASLEFVSYRLTEPKYDVEECLLRGMTYAAPIKVTVRLIVWDVNEETPNRQALKLNTPRGQMTTYEMGGKVYHIYNDPNYNTLYVGDETAYQNYLALAHGRNICQTVEGSNNTQFWSCFQEHEQRQKQGLER